jgi:hypothetical protein
MRSLAKIFAILRPYRYHEKSIIALSREIYKEGEVAATKEALIYSIENASIVIGLIGATLMMVSNAD